MRWALGFRGSMPKFNNFWLVRISGFRDLGFSDLGSQGFRVFNFRVLGFRA